MSLNLVELSFTIFNIKKKKKKTVSHVSIFHPLSINKNHFDIKLKN
jgi:hypothetical protein